MSSVYLGAAIDLASDLNAFQAMTDILLENELFANSLIFRPDTAWTNAKNIKNNEVGIDYLMKVNDYALLNADLAVFFISKNVFSAGVAHEIEKRLSVPRTTYIIAEKIGFYTMGQMNLANSEYIYNKRKTEQVDGRFSRVYPTMEEFRNNLQEHYLKDSSHFQDWLYTDTDNKRKYFSKIGMTNE